MKRLLLALLSGLVLTSTTTAGDWTRFRGDNGTGIVDAKGIPTSWDSSDYVFNIELPGVGHSSPVVLGDQLFITSALEVKGRDGGAVRYLLCLDANTGKEQWRRKMGFSPSHKHGKNSYASATPCTDGERLFVALADEDRYMLSAWGLDGEELWKQDLGSFKSQHGQGTSPIVHDGMVILPNDQQGPSAVVAFDVKTGERKWTAARTVRKTAYSTPMVLQLDGEAEQIITISGAMGVTSIDPKTGNTNWSSGEMLMRTVASPVYANGVIIATCGSGGIGKQMVAVNPSLKLQANDNRVVYEQKRILPYVPTPIVVGDQFILWNDNGVLRSIDADTGQTNWTERIGGNFSGSPIAIGDLLYCMSEAGECVVVRVGDGADVVSRVELGDRSHATPVVANGRLYLRTFHRLMCISGKDS